MTKQTTHRCDTQNPTRPCCWAARRAEREAAQAADAARLARYGTISCPKCGEVYAVVNGVVEDHEAVCAPLTAEQMWS